MSNRNLTRVAVTIMGLCLLTAGFDAAVHFRSEWNLLEFILMAGYALMCALVGSGMIFAAADA